MSTSSGLMKTVGMTISSASLITIFTASTSDAFGHTKIMIWSVAAGLSDEREHSFTHEGTSAAGVPTIQSRRASAVDPASGK
eukprot:CAMPEP_0185770196 /NCGR_PEP_ID=MMETSP1174-20130828/57948_1 /TAXON_ID=35687 /ORGANISM="Dictyocha speculum, Strain CCMP1381" /LENGTH=81 /DNA_ID=CAMNT_0028455541 /DNA_START=263 /DNA_END=508 /DNA_ORIENTATION=-